MMARPKSSILTESELRLMHVIWSKGSATVKDVVDALTNEHALAYTTVMTTLQTLTNKGFLRHEKQGRAFVYHPLVSQEETQRNAIDYIMSRFFNNSPELLMLNLLEHDDVDLNDLEKLKRLVSEEEGGDS